MKANFLVETALLGQGLYSCDDEMVRLAWCKRLPEDLQALAWLWQGEVVIGTIDEFLQIRHAENMGRFNGYTLAQAQAEGKSGFITAGGTMKLAAEQGMPFVISCGIGGVWGDNVSSDLPMLCSLPVALVATSPKDMIDSAATFDYLRQEGFSVYGKDCDVADGYLFVGERAQLDGSLNCKNGAEKPQLPADCKLLLNPLPRDKRMGGKDILRFAVQAGEAAAARGEEFHPAVNRALDNMTNGSTSAKQLLSLVENIKFVLKIFN